jgi:hypothetical protein
VPLSGCDSGPSSQVFLPWLDLAEYFLAPDGGLEAGGAGWALDGASVVAGNESYAVSGPGASALALPIGSSATTPEICVGVEHPTIRAFIRRTGGGNSTRLRVYVNFVDPYGEPRSLPIGVLSGTNAWQPSPIMLIGANYLPLLTGGDSTQVTFSFAPQGGSWQVDDVYVDPYGGR